MIKDRIISQINTLGAEDLMLLHGYVALLKKRPHAVRPASNNAHLRVRKALQGLKTSLSEEILASRAERL